MLPLLLIGTKDYFRVPDLLLQFVYPIILEVQPYCEDDTSGPPAQVKASVEFLMLVQNLECNCGEDECRFSRGRDRLALFLEQRLGIMLIMAQTYQLPNPDTMYRIAAMVNEDPELPEVPPMSVTDAVHIFQQADLLRRHIKLKKAQEQPKPKTKPKTPRRKKDL